MKVASWKTFFPSKIVALTVTFRVMVVGIIQVNAECQRKTEMDRKTRAIKLECEGDGSLPSLITVDGTVERHGRWMMLKACSNT